MERPHTIGLLEAERVTAPRVFNLMVKPAGSLCNLECRYCYYLDKAEIYSGKEPCMDERLLEKCIREYIHSNGVPELQFNWHGGEPTLMGLDFFRKVIELERKYADGRSINNTLQTNGTLLTSEWASFFKENDFLIGISIDGPERIHNAYRIERGGRPSFSRVMRGIELLEFEGVRFNTMTTVNHLSEGHGLEVYLFLKSIGSRYQQYMPVAELYPDGNPTSESVSPLGFGKFMCEIFDHWIANDIGEYFVTLFDDTLANWCGIPPGSCTLARNCGRNAVVEHNGDVYPCDHAVDSSSVLGNICNTSLAGMMESERMTRFTLDKRYSLPSDCLDCKWIFACNGECPWHRSPGSGRNLLCEGYRYFFRHVERHMDYMRDKILRVGEQNP